MYSYDYPRPALTTDCVIFGYTVNEKPSKILLIQRKNPPFQGMWAFPGGFVEMSETLEIGAARELQEETSLVDIPLKQFYVFDAIDRDPRERIITVAHYGFADLEKHTAKAGDDAKNVSWFNLTELPELAADHKQILAKALEAIAGL